MITNPDPPSVASALGSSVELAWIPLGAGQHVVKFSGKLYEALTAFIARRPPCDIYHAALTITVSDGRYTVEMTPIPDGQGERRGVVAEGPVGLKVLGRFRLFRYEIRRWRGGVIPDANQAMNTTIVSTDESCAQHLLDILPGVPTAVWGRDELHAGEMWNSNSVIAWLLAAGDLDTSRLQPPPRGRAPGWSSGPVVAAREPRAAPIHDYSVTSGTTANRRSRVRRPARGGSQDGSRLPGSRHNTGRG